MIDYCSQRWLVYPRGCKTRLESVCSLCVCAVSHSFYIPFSPSLSVLFWLNTNSPLCASHTFIAHLAIILCNLFSLSLIELNSQNLQLPAPATLDPSPRPQSMTARPFLTDARRINQCRAPPAAVSVSAHPPALICLPWCAFMPQSLDI